MKSFYLSNALIYLLLFWQCNFGQIKGSPSKNISEQDLHELFHQVLYHLENDYIYKLSKQKLWFGAINGLIDSISDNRTKLLSSKTFKDLTKSNKWKEMGLQVSTTGSISISEYSKEISEKDLKNLFYQIQNYIKSSYTENLNNGNNKKLWYSSIVGMVKSTDNEATHFVSPEELEELRNTWSKKTGGIGLEFTISDDVPIIISTFEKSPGARVGIRFGDKIIKIDKKPTKGMSARQVAQLLRGDIGTSVNISISREGKNKLLLFKIARDLIQIKSVTSKLIEDGKIGYIYLKEFRENTYDKVFNIIKDFKNVRVNGIILDLRYNSGGLLDSVYKIANLFLDKGIILSAKGRKWQYDRVYKVNPKLSLFVETPLVVLVNENSAAGSEILAAAVQENRRGKIIGVKTAGKATVQNVIPLSSNAAIELTIQVFYTPSGNLIQNKGVLPDIKIKNSKLTEIGSKFDIQLKKAISYFKK